LGKTTLVRHLLADKPYVSLDAPELLSEMQGVVDASGTMGQFVLTGSHNLSLLSSVTQSLAGRTGQLLNMQSLASDAFGNLKKWQKYALERGNFSAIYPGLVYGGSTRYTRLLCILSDLPPVTRIKSDTQRNSTPNKNGDRSPRHHASTVKISRPPGP
jgi:hypothetical protein